MEKWVGGVATVVFEPRPCRHNKRPNEGKQSGNNAAVVCNKKPIAQKSRKLLRYCPCCFSVPGVSGLICCMHSRRNERVKQCLHSAGVVLLPVERP